MSLVRSTGNLHTIQKHSVVSAAIDWELEEILLIECKSNYSSEQTVNGSSRVHKTNISNILKEGWKVTDSRVDSKPARVHREGKRETATK